jgi:hypothetical protein
MLTEIRARLGNIVGVRVCGEVQGPVREKVAPIVAEFAEVDRLMKELEKVPPPGKAGDPASLTTLPLFPGARLATEKEVRCLGIDGWQGDYDVVLSFASAAPSAVADFYREALGIAAAKTENGFRFVLNPPTTGNPMGDHIDIFKESVKNPCTQEGHTVRMTVFRRKSS